MRLRTIDNIRRIGTTKLKRNNKNKINSSTLYHRKHYGSLYCSILVMGGKMALSKTDDRCIFAGIAKREQIKHLKMDYGNYWKEP